MPAMAPKIPLTFFDLPPEIRDMIYAYFPHEAWISINQAPCKLQQPAIAFVNHQVRKEALAVFYVRAETSLVVPPLVASLMI